MILQKFKLLQDLVVKMTKRRLILFYVYILLGYFVLQVDLTNGEIISTNGRERSSRETFIGIQNDEDLNLSTTLPSPELQTSQEYDLKQKSSSSFHQNSKIMELFKKIKPRTSKSAFTTENEKEELEEKYNKFGVSPRDEVVRMIEKLVSPNHHPRFESSFNYGNGKTNNILLLPLHSLPYFKEFESRDTKEDLNNPHHYYQPSSLQQYSTDPFNQLFNNIYHRQGTTVGHNSYVIPLSSQNTQYYQKNPYFTHNSLSQQNSLFPLPIGTYTDEKSQKRSNTNPGYICHFKLCQFGSSGKRLYKPGNKDNT